MPWSTDGPVKSLTQKAANIALAKADLAAVAKAKRAEEIDATAGTSPEQRRRVRQAALLRIMDGGGNERRGSKGRMA
jgi:hypothetical protein